MPPLTSGNGSSTMYAFRAPGQTACASCQDPDFAFAEPRRTLISDSGRSGQRNAPSTDQLRPAGRAHVDGWFRTLEQQALSPFRRGEMGIGVEEAEHWINRDPEYVRAFRVVFGTQPAAQTLARALAAYERTLFSQASRFIVSCSIR